MNKEHFKIAIKNLRTRSLRSWLIILGVVIGVFLVVVLLSLLGEYQYQEIEKPDEKDIINQEIEKPVEKDIIIPERRDSLEELRYMPGEVLVIFKEEVTNEEKTAIIEKLDFEIIEKVMLTDIYRIKLPVGVAVSEAVEKLNKLDEIKHVQPNYIFDGFRKPIIF